MQNTVSWPIYGRQISPAIRKSAIKFILDPVWMTSQEVNKPHHHPALLHNSQQRWTDYETFRRSHGLCCVHVSKHALYNKTTWMHPQNTATAVSVIRLSSLNMRMNEVSRVRTVSQTLICEVNGTESKWAKVLVRWDQFPSLNFILNIKIILHIHCKTH